MVYGLVVMNKETRVLVLPLHVFAERLKPWAVLGQLEKESTAADSLGVQTAGVLYSLLMRYSDFKRRESHTNAESGNRSATDTKRILTGIFFVA